MDALPTPPPVFLTDPHERRWSMVAHASAFFGLLFPLLNVVGPLVVWLMKKDTLPLATDQAREAVNFNITVCLVALVFAVLVLVSIGYFLLILLGIYWVAFTVVAIVATGSGRAYRYPFTWRLV